MSIPGSPLNPGPVNYDAPFEISPIRPQQQQQASHARTPQQPAQRQPRPLQEQQQQHYPDESLRTSPSKVSAARTYTAEQVEDILLAQEALKFRQEADRISKAAELQALEQMAQMDENQYLRGYLLSTEDYLKLQEEYAAQLERTKELEKMLLRSKLQGGGPPGAAAPVRAQKQQAAPAMAAQSSYLDEPLDVTARSPRAAVAYQNEPLSRQESVRYLDEPLPTMSAAQGQQKTQATATTKQTVEEKVTIQVVKQRLVPKTVLQPMPVMVPVTVPQTEVVDVPVVTTRLREIEVPEDEDDDLEDPRTFDLSRMSPREGRRSPRPAASSEAAKKNYVDWASDYREHYSLAEFERTHSRDNSRPASPRPASPRPGRDERGSYSRGGAADGRAADRAAVSSYDRTRYRAGSYDRKGEQDLELARVEDTSVVGGDEPRPGMKKKVIEEVVRTFEPRPVTRPVTHMVPDVRMMPVTQMVTESYLEPLDTIRTRLLDVPEGKTVAEVAAVTPATAENTLSTKIAPAPAPAPVAAAQPSFLLGGTAAQNPAMRPPITTTGAPVTSVASFSGLPNGPSAPMPGTQFVSPRPMSVPPTAMFPGQQQAPGQQQYQFPPPAPSAHAYGQAAPQQYGQPAAANPYGQPGGAASYGQPPAVQQYGQGAPAAYGQGSAQQYGQGAPVAYGQGAAAQPYGQGAAAQPYGQSAAAYGQAGAASYGQTGAAGYGQAASQPYAATTSQPGYTPAPQGQYGAPAPGAQGYGAQYSSQQFTSAGARYGQTSPSSGGIYGSTAGYGAATAAPYTSATASASAGYGAAAYGGYPAAAPAPGFSVTQQYGAGAPSAGGYGGYPGYGAE